LLGRLFFGMCFLPDITHSSLKNARQLIEHLREMPERVLLISFIPVTVREKAR